MTVTVSQSVDADDDGCSDSIVVDDDDGYEVTGTTTSLAEEEEEDPSAPTSRGAIMAQINGKRASQSMFGNGEVLR